MSVFRVKLTQGLQGNMEVAAGYADLVANSAGANFSEQRTLYVMGPKKMNRLLADGATFTDCNYWKRFVSVANGGDAASPEAAFLEIVTDDGSIWSDDTQETTTIAQITYTTQAAYANSTWTCPIGVATSGTGAYDILANLGGYASFIIMTNGAQATKLNLNSAGTVAAPTAGTVLDIASSGTITLSADDILVGRLALQGTSTTVYLVIGVKAQANS